MIITKNFYYYSQKIIEDFYLQPLLKDNAGFPLPKKIKSNLKDGSIERELHGGMHAGRVQFYTKILHEKMKEMFPSYTQKVILILSNSLSLSEEQLLSLIRYAALFHDSARENESTDVWDEISAENCFKFLTANGLPPDLAEIFSMAAACKDSPNRYEAFLLSRNIDEENIKFYQYIRKLVYMSDCFDIMRCTRNFKLENILAALRDIDEYNPKEHNHVMIDMAKEIYQLIRDQKDMLFTCKITLPNGNELQLKDTSSCFDLKAKTGLEHAENTCSALGQSIKDHPYFTKYLENECFLSTKKAEIVPAFNPYVHGTNSLVLSLLEYTNLSMVSPIEMLETYGTAPMGGEISGGGLDIVSARCDTCFGRLNAKGINDYTLDKIISNYTHFDPSTAEETRDKAKNYADNSLNSAFSNVNIMLIYLARAKQQGIEAISKAESEKLLKEMEATIQFFYLILLLGKKIHPNFKLTETYSKESKYDFYNAVYTHLTFRELVNRIMNSNISIKEIYTNPTNENLLKVLSVLELPKDSVLHSEWEEKPKPVSLPETQLFTINQQHYITNKPQDLDDPDYYFYRMSQNLSGYSINKLLKQFIQGRITPQFFGEFETKALEHIKALSNKIDVLNKIVHTNLDVMKFSNRQKYFLNHPFPMVFICESEDKISLIDFNSQEYRSKAPLKLGKDIKMIATDTEEHRLAIMKYLEENHIYDTQVILFDQLFLSQMDGKHPQSTYFHKDGFPLLSWLAAKKMSEQIISKDKAINEKLSAAQRYRGIRFE